MDDMIELEDYCVFCSKYLAGMHDFNKKMHFNTCKLRKLFDSVYTDSDSSDVDQFFIEDNCSFCLKPLKDFKSEYNKRIHIKCCKIKKETFERRDSILQLQQTEEQSAATSAQSNDLSPAASLLQSLTEACIFCSKPLGNLNSFNRKMHIEHCKIRKSLEGNIRSSGKNKDEIKAKQNRSDIGDQCVYCNKSFARLSDFNRRLHSEHCKSKKRKLKTLNNVINNSLNLSALHTQSPESNYGSNIDQVQNSLILLANNSCPNTPLKGSASMNIGSSLDQSTSQNNNSGSHSQNSSHSCEYCEFCSRSLANLSNFNKNIHIEQCKLKQAKKTINGQMKQSSRPKKRAKTSDKDKSIHHEFCTSQILTHLDLGASTEMASSSNSNPNLSISNSTSSNSVQSVSSNPQLSHQFNESNATTIISLDNTTLHQLSLAASQSQNLLNGATHTLQITLDPNTNQIYI